MKLRGVFAFSPIPSRTEEMKRKKTELTQPEAEHADTGGTFFESKVTMNTRRDLNRGFCKQEMGMGDDTLR